MEYRPTQSSWYSLRLFGVLGFWHLAILLPILLIGATLALGPLGFAWAALMSFSVVGLGIARAIHITHPIDPSEVTDYQSLHDETARRLYQSLYPCAAFAIQIDELSVLCERFNHPQIEQILLQTQSRLHPQTRQDDLVVRLRGFQLVVLTGPDGGLSLDAAVRRAQRYQTAISGPITVEGSNTLITASVGFCISSRLSSPTADNLIQAANAALISAQRHGPGAVRSYSERLHEQLQDRILLSDQVEDGFQRSQILAYFQPQVSASDEKVIGFEALVRWHHPTRGPLAPLDFLPAIKDAGAMGQLSKLMIEQALGALRFWDERGIEVPLISVNFSRAELADQNFPDIVSKALSSFGIPPHRLGIEVLESVVHAGVADIVTNNLAKLATMGCQIDLDDFGSGQTSITSVRDFSIHRIKIDRSFISNIDEDADQQKIVQAILRMADGLGLQALAEGVETLAEQSTLVRLGCDQMQGFSIAHPMPLSQTVDWLDAYGARSVTKLERPQSPPQAI